MSKRCADANDRAGWASQPKTASPHHSGHAVRPMSPDRNTLRTPCRSGSTVAKACAQPTTAPQMAPQRQPRFTQRGSRMLR
eukprot:CAMPEP_0183448112 /NCGR_PEP_ID=MMETSP0370-20130417/105212_1 /TAXON_ID=268820 /ORGANISM="Peridinium aciculiferum, Strain PAER-2" /LENGTH=80 /DNA_ID=CAMNT_0025639033 /DNA_START=12 /DNA_END=251 /DNA_ORIENTATION=+